VTYDVFLAADDSTPDTLICDNVTITSCTPSALSYETHYYWQVVATDEHDATRIGAVWDFTTHITPTVNLSVTKTGSPNPGTAGNPLTYTITVSNSGPITATGVMVTDTLPSTVDFASASTDCSESDGIVICNLADLTPDTTATITIAVVPTATGLITNHVSAMPNEHDADLSDNTDFYTTVITLPISLLYGHIPGAAYAAPQTRANAANTGDTVPDRGTQVASGPYPATKNTTYNLRVAAQSQCKQRAARPALTCLILRQTGQEMQVRTL